MNLPLSPPVLPMLAKSLDEIPTDGGFQFEPKWDGFRIIVFRDGDELLIQSREGKPLDRYFPEMRAPLLAQLPPRCVLDGELVIPVGSSLEFEVLQMRIHPAESRIKKLAVEFPAEMVFWDVLCLGDEDLTRVPLRDRRARLEGLLAQVKPPLHLTPATMDATVALDWFHRFEGAGLDGVMAKPLNGIYEPDKRTMFKVKHERTADCVVAGFRWHKNGEGTLIGAVLLGLYDEHGKLQNVGAMSAFTAKKRAELVEFFAPLRVNAAEGHPWTEWGGHEDETGQRMPGQKNRWNSKKDMSWELLRPELVAEVAYDHMQGNRFRHNAQFRRWRTDKKTTDCTYGQLERTPPFELREIFKKRAAD